MRSRRGGGSGHDLTPGQLRRLSVCIINPRYEPTFWGYDFALPLLSREKRYSNVNGALPTLAALAPPHRDVVLLDENVEAIDFASLRRFDVIGLTGMIIQSVRMREILTKLGRLDAVIIVGGPYVSVAEEAFEGLCDVRFVGEAEETWPAFLTALAAGEPTAARYQQAEKTDMTRVPTPRFDLVDAKRYQTASVQYARGCPFLCEFCDIITIYGRRPRVKTVEQMMREFDAVRAAGFTHCFVADDNFIGNKKSAKALLQEVIVWQKAQGYPLLLDTQASINLADDAELIDLMFQANFRQVFIGIESPRASSLAEVRKVQNVAGASLLEKIARVRAGGLVVNAGFIVGFDSDDESIFDEQFDFIQRSGIAQAGVSLLMRSAQGRRPAGFRRPQHSVSAEADDPGIAQGQISRSHAEARRAGRLFPTLVRRLSKLPPVLAPQCGPGSFHAPGQTQRRAPAPGRRCPVRGARARDRSGEGGSPPPLRGPYIRAWVTENVPLRRDAVPIDAFVRLCIHHWHFHKIASVPTTSQFSGTYPHLLDI